MVLTVVLVLGLASFICAIAAASNPPRVPLWIAVLLLSIALMLQSIPLK